MELAGDLVQDLAKFAGIKELESVAHFPAELSVLASVITAVSPSRLDLAPSSLNPAPTPDTLDFESQPLNPKP